MSDRAGQASTSTIAVCRSCCCGALTKHPDVDHDSQLDQLQAGAGHTVRVQVSECLDVCDRSNVVVVRPSPAGRLCGGRPVWLGEVLDAAATAAILNWVNEGGPGIAPMPKALARHTFRAPGPS